MKRTPIPKHFIHARPLTDSERRRLRRCGLYAGRKWLVYQDDVGAVTILEPRSTYAEPGPHALAIAGWYTAHRAPHGFDE